MNWKKIENAIQSFTQKYNDEINDYDDCKHTIIEINGFNTCVKCGGVISQIFKVVDEENGHEFYEDKKRIKSKYSQINEIKIKFLDYLIVSQSRISNIDYRTFVLRWNENKYTSITKRNIKECIESCNLEIRDINKYYYNILNDKNMCSNSMSITNCMITEVLKICKSFISFYKSKVKNINKRALLYSIFRNDYNIILSDYIGFMKSHTVKKYADLYIGYKENKRN